MTSEKCFECEGELTKTCLSCNTRAIPDVPELVRYAPVIGDDGRLEKFELGPYVRYDQAIEMLAAEQQKTKDAEELASRMDGFAKKYLRHLNNEKQGSEQKSKDWFGFCELIGVDIDSHEAVADKINAIKERAEAAEAKLATLKEINANLMGDDEDKPRYTTKRLKLEVEKAVTAKLAQYLQK